MINRRKEKRKEGRKMKGRIYDANGNNKTKRKGRESKEGRE